MLHPPTAVLNRMVTLLQYRDCTPTRLRLRAFGQYTLGTHCHLTRRLITRNFQKITLLYSFSGTTLTCLCVFVFEVTVTHNFPQLQFKRRKKMKKKKNNERQNQRQTTCSKLAPTTSGSLTFTKSTVQI